MENKKKRISLVLQVAILFLVATIVTGLITYFTQRDEAAADVRDAFETRTKNNAKEVLLSIREYPAYMWLLKYWYENHETLDVEYDVDYYYGEKTREKSKTLIEHQPDLLLKYATVAQVEAMPAEDQKLYAEIVYSWLITRLNQIKRSYNLSFLFVVAADNEYKTQFFFLSAANAGDKRGRDFEDVYTLGTTVTVGSESQSEAMFLARSNMEYLADAGKYIDYYSYVADVDGRQVFIGLTYNMADIKAEVNRDTIYRTISAMSYLIILAFLCSLLIYFFVLRPLRKVQSSISDYEKEKSSTKMIKALSEVKSRNEIGDLATNIGKMTVKIDEYVDDIQNITAEKERIETELELGTRIQRGMIPNKFPAFPERTEFDIYATMDPAREVGGDFYDYFLIDDDHLCLVIADVSGKGVPAALFMMASKIILVNNAGMKKSPAEILADTNNAVCSNNQEEMFVTVWLGILEISTGRLTAANAGHEYPCLKDPGGEFRFVKDKHGFVLGGIEGMKYSEYELQLEKGSKLFLYTDGVPEATDAGENLFGAERIISSLNEVGDGTPREILVNVRKQVDIFVNEAEQFDDLTMLCIEYKGKGTD